MRILLVKLSSMGDVIHNLPVVSDLVRAFPGVTIDWVTESPYAPLVALHPDVSHALPVHLRSLKKQWWKQAQWTQLSHDRALLDAQDYDAILDTQGLVKSAIVACWASGPRYGMSRDTIREPLAARFYQHTFAIGKNSHAVTRNRQLAAATFGYSLDENVDYGLSGILAQTPRPAWLSGQRYIVMLHATSRADKQWPTANWIALGKRLQASGFTLVFPWGSEAERQTSESLVDLLVHTESPVVPPALSLTEAAGLLGGASAVVGVDTGLTHLAVAFGRPTVGLYLTTSPELTGLFGSSAAVNLGGGTRVKPANPGVDAVLEAFQPWLS